MTKRISTGVAMLSVVILTGGCSRKHHFVRTQQDGLMLDKVTGVECWATEHLVEKPENQARVNLLSEQWQTAKKDEGKASDAVNAYQESYEKSHPKPSGVLGNEGTETPTGVVLGKDPNYRALFDKQVAEGIKVDELFKAMNAAEAKAVTDLIPDPEYPVCSDLK
jgi:hypothetical protein